MAKCGCTVISTLRNNFNRTLTRFCDVNAQIALFDLRQRSYLFLADGDEAQAYPVAEAGSPGANQSCFSNSERPG